MYKRELHGKQKTEWCDKCEKILKCDCSNLTEQRIKDIELDTEDGIVCKTIYISHCVTCGTIFDMYEK